MGSDEKKVMGSDEFFFILLFLIIIDIKNNKLVGCIMYKH
jgi:hypothetical protein